MNLESANAFLKTLEEPPQDSIIILITDRQALLLPTIISRCRIIKFYPMPRMDLETTLLGGRVGGVCCSQQEAHFLAYLSEGSIGKALKMKKKESLRKK